MTKRRPSDTGEVDFRLFFLLEDSTSDWHVLKLACQGKGEGRTVCVCGCFKGLWDFNEDIKSLL